jgi:hypothetical protein
LRNDRAYRPRLMAEARNLLLNMLRCDLPLVAAIKGPAIGVGCTIALATDVLVMSPTSYPADPHVSSGIVAGDGGALLLPLLVGLPPRPSSPLYGSTDRCRHGPAGGPGLRHRAGGRVAAAGARNRRKSSPPSHPKRCGTPSEPSTCTYFSRAWCISSSDP